MSQEGTKRFCPGGLYERSDSTELRTFGGLSRGVEAFVIFPCRASSERRAAVTQVWRTAATEENAFG